MAKRINQSSPGGKKNRRISDSTQLLLHRLYIVYLYIAYAHTFVRNDNQPHTAVRGESINAFALSIRVA